MAMASTGCVRSYHQPGLQDGKSTFRVPNHLELMKKVGVSLGIFWFMAMIQPGSSHFDILHLLYYLLYNNIIYIYRCVYAHEQRPKPPCIRFILGLK